MADGIFKVLRLLAPNVLFFTFGAVVASVIGMPHDQPARMVARPYNDQITLPVEAFGASWHIQRFRKSVRFPSNIDVALNRAMQASIRLGADPSIRSVAISLAPVAYRIRAPITIPADMTNTIIDFNGATIFSEEQSW